MQQIQFFKMAAYISGDLSALWRLRQSTRLFQIEQLERLCSEDTLSRLMITPTIESYWIPSQKKKKSKLHI